MFGAGWTKVRNMTFDPMLIDRVLNLLEFLERALYRCRVWLEFSKAFDKVLHTRLKVSKKE